MTLQKKANHAMGKNLLLNQIGKFKFEEKSGFIQNWTHICNNMSSLLYESMK